MTKGSLVSVITPTFNSERFIAETIRSVKQQTYRNWEMIIIDDASVDRTVEVVKKEQESDDRIKLITLNDNIGAAGARNTGINHAKGKYIAFLDSDDLWVPNKLEEQIKFMEDNNYAFTFSGYAVIDQFGNHLGKEYKAVSQANYKDILKKPGTIGCLTVILDKEKIDDVLMPNIKIRNDFATWLKILKKGHIAYGLDKTLAYYRLVPGSISSNKLKAAKKNWYVYRKIEKLSFFSSTWYFMNYVIYNIQKRLIK